MRPLAALALAAAGCAPTVIWSGHSADRRHSFEVVQEADHQRVIVDGARRAAYTRVAAWSLQSAGSRIVHAARLGRDWIVVDAGRPSPRWDGIGELAVSGEHTAYAAERAGRWQVAVDGATGPAWDAVLAGTLQFSPTGAHLVYAARDAAGVHVVVDGAIGPAYDGVAHLVFSDDGAHVGYVARAGDGATVIVDGQPAPRHREVARLRLLGARPVYAARDAAGWRVVAAAASPPYREVRALVTAGGHAAWIARDDLGELVACDGELVARAAAFDPARLALVRGCDVAYATRDAGGVHVVHRDLDHACDEVGSLVVGPGGRLAFAARRGGSWSIVVDAEAHPIGSYAGDPVFSPDGTHLAYVARQGGRWLAIVDGRAFAFDLLIDGSLAFSRDSRHWAVIGGDLAREQLFFAVDGARRVPLAPIEIYSVGEHATVHAVPGDDGAVLRAWAAAEADRS
ncbi:MAG TPA: hypothetical protein VHW23_18665 [Kofleriaceae bacterium]|nr:hypothetical protein [Kofleriaceae bacterium]